MGAQMLQHLAILLATAVQQQPLLPTPTAQQQQRRPLRALVGVAVAGGQQPRVVVVPGATAAAAPPLPLALLLLRPVATALGQRLQEGRACMQSRPAWQGLPSLEGAVGAVWCYESAAEVCCSRHGKADFGRVCAVSQHTTQFAQDPLLTHLLPTTRPAGMGAVGVVQQQGPLAGVFSVVGMRQIQPRIFKGLQAARQGLSCGVQLGMAGQLVLSRAVVALSASGAVCPLSCTRHHFSS